MLCYVEAVMVVTNQLTDLTPSTEPKFGRKFYLNLARDWESFQNLTGLPSHEPNLG